jgi:hypothetical protein
VRPEQLVQLDQSEQLVHKEISDFQEVQDQLVCGGLLGLLDMMVPQVPQVLKDHRVQLVLKDQLVPLD